MGRKTGRNTPREYFSSTSCIALNILLCLFATIQELDLVKAGLRSLSDCGHRQGGRCSCPGEGLPITVRLGSTGCRNPFLGRLRSPSFPEVICLESVLRNSACIGQLFSGARRIKSFRFTTSYLFMQKFQLLRYLKIFKTNLLYSIF